MLASAAYAQNEKTGAVDEIVVTATLRSMNVQDVPLAVTAISPETLERQGVFDVRTLSSVTPGFSIQPGQNESRATTFRIRGVGTTGNNSGLESSVGVFIDGVYQSRPGVALGDLVDLEHMEVLRGPQGTLFGRNTSAGALTVTTRKPNLTKVEGFANATYGNYNLMNLQGGINLPVAQDLAAVRLTGAWRKRDGYVKSATGAESYDRNRWMMRGQLYVEPTPEVSVRIIADYAKIDEKCCDAIITRETELQPFFAYHGLAYDGVDQVGAQALRNLSSNTQQYLDGSKQWGVSGELQWDFGVAKLTSITAYRHFITDSTEDDFTGLLSYSVGRHGATFPNGAPRNGDEVNTFTQELRLQGLAFDNKLDWLVGAYYSNEDIGSQAVLGLGPDFQAAASAGIFGDLAGVNPVYAFTAFGNNGTPVDANGAYAVNEFSQKGKSLSLFTHNVFNVTDRVALTLTASKSMSPSST